MIYSASKGLLKWSIISIGVLIGSIIFLSLNSWIDSFLGSRFNALWLLQGSEKDYAVWFPRYYLIAYWGVRLLVVAVLTLLLVSVYRFVQFFRTRLTLDTGAKLIDCLPANGVDLYSNVKFLSLAVAISLFVFLTAYAAVKRGILFQGLDDFYAQLIITRGFAITLLTLIFVSVVAKWKDFTKLVSQFFYKPDTPYNLAVLRIVFFGFMAITCWLYPSFHQAYFELDPQPLPYMQWYIDLIDLSPDQYGVVCKVTAVVNFLIAIGLLTRPMLMVNSVLIFVVIATPNFYGKLFHQHLWIWIPWILTFSRCADVLSLDSLINKYRGRQKDTSLSIDYGLPVRLIWITFGVVYFFPGFQKLWAGGFDWALTDSMLNQIYVEWHQHYGWRSIIPVERIPNLVKAGGLFIILFEMSYPFLLLTDRTRKVAIFGGLLFHILTGLTLNIWFPPVLWMYVFFINWGAIFSSYPQSVKSTVRYSLPRNLMIGVASILFFMNSLFGVAAIYSYPFTSFPGYSQIYGDELEMLVIETREEFGEWQNVDALLSDAAYRRENNTPYEQSIIDSYNEGRSTDKQVQQYWKLLTASVPRVAEVDYYRVKIRVVPLHPERNGEIISEVDIYSSIQGF